MGVLLDILGKGVGESSAEIVLGVGGWIGDDPPTPQLTADVDASADAVTITHTGDNLVSASEFGVVAYADGGTR